MFFSCRTQSTLTLLSAVFLAGCAGPVARPSVAPQGVDATAQVWLLGEVHDNPAGHRQRYELLRQRVEAGRIAIEEAYGSS